MKKAFTKSILILICIYISICSFSLGACFLCSHKGARWHLSEPSTCYNEGLETKACVYCRKIIETRKVPKLEHKIEWIVVEDSTCDELGLKKKMCRNCKVVEDSEEIPKKIHKIEWILIEDSTCDEMGLKKKMCKNCKVVEEREDIPKKEHVLEWKVINDCDDESKGLCVKQCINCNSIVSYRGSALLDYTLNEDGNSYTANLFREFKEDDCFIQPTYKGLTVTDIADGLLYGKESLYRLTIPNSVIRIGAEAFRHCNNLRYVYFLENSKLEIIDVGAFDSCTNLETIIIPNSVLSIKDYAFSCCNIKSIIIPKNVINLGKNVFAGCTGLTDIYCEAQEKPEGWNDLWNNDCSATVHWGYVGEN